MNFFPTFGFKGTILPVIDKTDKLYLFVENDNEHRVLLNIISSDVNKFINIEPKCSKIIHSGIFKPTLQLKIFYLGQELFDFSCDELNKEHLLFYSDYILKKETSVIDSVSFDPIFIDGLKLNIQSNKPQCLYIKIVDNDNNKILHEDNFISTESFIFNQNCFVNYGIYVYDKNGQKIYDYNFDLKNKKVWIKLESNSISELMDWIPCVEEFRKKHQCEVWCSTHWNNLFISEYPNVKFTNSNEITKLKNLFAIYKIKNNNQNKESQKIAYELLGIEYKKTKLNPILEHIKEISTSNTI